MGKFANYFNMPPTLLGGLFQWPPRGQGAGPVDFWIFGRSLLRGKCSKSNGRGRSGARSAERSPSGGYPALRHDRTRGGITAQCCCYGSKRWDDDSKKRLKRCHGSKEWDDGSTQELLRPFIPKGDLRMSTQQEEGTPSEGFVHLARARGGPKGKAQPGPKPRLCLNAWEGGPYRGAKCEAESLRIPT